MINKIIDIIGGVIVTRISILDGLVVQGKRTHVKILVGNHQSSQTHKMITFCLYCTVRVQGHTCARKTKG